MESEGCDSGESVTGDEWGRRSDGEEGSASACEWGIVSAGELGRRSDGEGGKKSVQ